jgi:hypothetical protein
MKNTIIAIAATSMMLIIGCIPHMENYPKEPCVSMPSDNVFKAIQDNCIKCHTKDYTTKEDICVRKNRIIDAVSTGRMPKIGKLYQEYKDTIINWK